MTTLTKAEIQQVLAALNKYIGAISIINDGPYASDFRHADKMFADSIGMCRDAIALLQGKLIEQEPQDAVPRYNQGVADCMDRLFKMHANCSGAHNFYKHAAIELAKLKERNT